MAALEDAALRLDTGHRADEFGMVGSLLDAKPEGQACVMLGIAPGMARLRLVLHPDDVARLSQTTLDDGRIALDIVAAHDDGATVVVGTGCAHATTALYMALDDIVADLDAYEDEINPRQVP